jgi:hypothetical protein
MHSLCGHPSMVDQIAGRSNIPNHLRDLGTLRLIGVKNFGQVISDSTFACNISVDFGTCIYQVRRHTEALNQDKRNPAIKDKPGSMNISFVIFEVGRDRR